MRWQALEESGWRLLELAHENFWSLRLEDFVYSMFACSLVLVCEFQKFKPCEDCAGVLRAGATLPACSTNTFVGDSGGVAAP